MPSSANDILGRRPQSVRRAYSADNFQIAISGRDNTFMLVQQIGFNYAQQVSRLFDLENADYQAYVAARPQGQMTISNVITDLGGMVDFTQQYGDVCSAETGKNITVSIEGKGQTGLCQKQGGSISFSQPVLVSASVSMSVADYLVSNNMAFIFASASYGGNTTGS